MPVPPPIASSHAREAGWWERHWKWMVPVLLLAMVGCVFASLAGVLALMKRSGAYAATMSELRASPEVAAALGTPVSDEWFFTGNIRTQGDAGRAELQIPIRGPKRGGTAHAILVKRSGEWAVVQLLITFDGRERLVVRHGDD